MTPTNTPNRGEPPVDLTAEVPETDAAEQATPAVPEPSDAPGYPDDIEVGQGEEDTLIPAPPTSGEADPVDAWEQVLPVPGEDDDDYDCDAGSSR